MEERKLSDYSIISLFEVINITLFIADLNLMQHFKEVIYIQKFIISCCLDIL